MSFIGGQIPSGVVLDYAGATAPQGYLLCFGQSVSRTTYAALFAAIGTTYGSVDGASFNIPDCRGRSIFGKDDMGGSAASRITNAISGITGTTLGAVGGSQSMQSHQHAATGLTNSTSAVTGTANSGVNLAHSHGISDGGHFHNQQDYSVGAGGPVIGTRRDIYAAGTLAGTNTPTTTDPTGISINNSGSLDHSHSLSGTAAAQTISGSVQLTGAGASQNMTPTIIMNKIIKV